MLAKLTLQLLLSLAKRTQGATLADLAADAGCAVAEIEAALNVLAGVNLCEDDPVFAHRYRLAERAAELGMSGFNIALRTRAWPYLQRLHDLTQQKIGLAVIEGDFHRFIDECPHRPQSVLAALPPLRYAEPARLRAGSTAKAILASFPEPLAEQILARNADVVDPSNEAYVDVDAWRRAAPNRDELTRIRQAGYASSRGERGRDTGTVSLSAPVLDRAGSVCGVLWVGGTAPERETPVAAALVQAAKELSAELAQVSSVSR